MKAIFIETCAECPHSSASVIFCLKEDRFIPGGRSSRSIPYFCTLNDIIPPVGCDDLTFSEAMQ